MPGTGKMSRAEFELHMTICRTGSICGFLMLVAYTAWLLGSHHSTYSYIIVGIIGALLIYGETYSILGLITGKHMKANGQIQD
jgi:hypothetical protein